MTILRAIAEVHPEYPYLSLIFNLPDNLRKKYYAAWRKDLAHEPLSPLEEEYWTRQKEQLLDEWERYPKKDDAQRESLALTLFPLIPGQGDDVATGYGYSPEGSINACIDLTHALYQAELRILEQTRFSHLYKEGRTNDVDPLGVWADTNGHKITLLDGYSTWYTALLGELFYTEPHDLRRERSWLKKMLPLEDEDSLLIAGKSHVVDSWLQHQLQERGITLETIFDGQMVMDNFCSKLDTYFMKTA